MNEFALTPLGGACCLPSIKALLAWDMFSSTRCKQALLASRVKRRRRCDPLGGAWCGVFYQGFARVGYVLFHSMLASSACVTCQDPSGHRPCQALSPLRPIGKSPRRAYCYVLFIEPFCAWNDRRGEPMCSPILRLVLCLWAHTQVRPYISKANYSL